MLIYCKRKVLLAGWVVGGWADWVCVRRRCVRRARETRVRFVPATGNKGIRGEGKEVFFPAPKQYNNISRIIEIEKIPKWSNFKTICMTWVIFQKAYELRSNCEWHTNNELYIKISRLIHMN